MGECHQTQVHWGTYQDSWCIGFKIRDSLINGIELHFVFDTGASVVSMSDVEATFMFKNGYISKNDIIGSSNYMTASGKIEEGTIINIKKVDFGGLTLENIRASVVKNQNAPLLLGQTVLGRLGKIEIDNNSHVLRISQ